MEIHMEMEMRESMNELKDKFIECYNWNVDLSDYLNNIHEKMSELKDSIKESLIDLMDGKDMQS